MIVRPNNLSWAQPSNISITLSGAMAQLSVQLPSCCEQIRPDTIIPTCGLILSPQSGPSPQSGEYSGSSVGHAAPSVFTSVSTSVSTSVLTSRWHMMALHMHTHRHPPQCPVPPCAGLRSKRRAVRIGSRRFRYSEPRLPVYPGIHSESPVCSEPPLQTLGDRQQHSTTPTSSRPKSQATPQGRGT
jgi:hypothetical protein